jgi:hypothetical protein
MNFGEGTRARVPLAFCAIAWGHDPASLSSNVSRVRENHSSRWVISPYPYLTL